jgi:hypothetical protein
VRWSVIGERRGFWGWAWGRRTPTPTIAATFRTPFEGQTNGIFGLLTDPWSSKDFAVRPRPRKTRPYSLLDHGPFKLRENAQHLKQRFSSRSGRVEALLMQIKVDLERMDFCEEADQVLQRPAEPINTPSHNEIEPPLGCVFAETIKLRPLIMALGSADAVVAINLDDIDAHPVRDLLQFELLVLGRLTSG